jgi:Raf kinase inhibitor-like YbhB/YbcL family protein
MAVLSSMLTLTSRNFSDHGSIPRHFTCDGDGVSPELEWTGAPPGTVTFVLIVHDPDVPDPAAPKRTWIHWVLYNLPASLSRLDEAIEPRSLGNHVREGLNDSHEQGYDPPCPPRGRHRYIHTLYALDIELPDLGASATRDDVEREMRNHVLEQASLTGTYQRA